MGGHKLKSKLTLQIPSICLGIVSTLYSFVYISLLWFDYFSQTKIHESSLLFYPFVIFGSISILLSFSILRIVKSRHFAQTDEKNSSSIRKIMIILSRVNLFLVLLNLFTLATWIIFIAGPGV